jgi:hypothetical protein
VKPGHRIVDELDCGFGWLLDERYARTSHALADDRRVWLVDPVDVEGLDARSRGLGEPAGVIQLLDRHRRDCAAIAGRYGVPHHVVPTALPETPFEVVPLVGWRRWREVALWWPERRILVAADAVGTSRFFAGDEVLGVHPVLRVLKPPRALARLEPEHLLVGHGPGVHGAEAAEALRRALARARTGLPRWGANVAAGIVRGEIR